MKGLLVLSLTMLSIWSSGSRADNPATHGMLLFGQQKTYASHLPMFHAPHDYQVILELKLGAFPHSQAYKQYNELKVTSNQIFTLVPEPFDLTKIIDGTMKNFVATIYHGHFEKNGQSLGLVGVEVTKVILGAKLDPNHSEAPQKFLVFGGNGEYFAAHLIFSKPSFDAILTVKQPYTLEEGICTGRACHAPSKVLVPDSQLPLTLNGGRWVPELNSGLGTFGGILTDITKLNYVEEGELSH